MTTTSKPPKDAVWAQTREGAQPGEWLYIKTWRNEYYPSQVMKRGRTLLHMFDQYGNGTTGYRMSDGHCPTDNVGTPDVLMTAADRALAERMIDIELRARELGIRREWSRTVSDEHWEKIVLFAEELT